MPALGGQLQTKLRSPAPARLLLCGTPPAPCPLHPRVGNRSEPRGPPTFEGAGITPPWGASLTTTFPFTPSQLEYILGPHVFLNKHKLSSHPTIKVSPPTQMPEKAGRGL